MKRNDLIIQPQPRFKCSVEFLLGLRRMVILSLQILMTMIGGWAKILMTMKDEQGKDNDICILIHMNTVYI